MKRVVSKLQKKNGIYSEIRYDGKDLIEKSKYKEGIK